MTEISTEAVVVQPQGTPSSSLADVYAREHDGLARLACLLTGSTVVAEDVVHDAFVQLQQRWTRVERPGAYLRTAVVNGCRGYHRKLRRERASYADLVSTATLPETPLVLDVLARLGELTGAEPTSDALTSSANDDGVEDGMADSEILIRGGDVVDGTGASARRADVRVRGDEIVEVGTDLAVDGATVIDATGAVVTPGFIDTHCHTDPQVFWDPYVDPDLLHGVTTMLVGNCSLSLYPVTDATRSDVSDLFSYIEDVPRHLFDDAVPWTWSDYAGYRDVVNTTGTGINLAGLVGHSMLRLVAMGPDAWTRAATGDETAAMAAMLRAAMDEGAWGLSTSFLDVDQQGRPVPSRVAEGDEFDALFDVLEAAGRGVVEVVPDLLGPTAMDTLRDLGQRCGKRGIPITWTGFTYVDSAPHRTQRWVDLASELADDGVTMYPQLSPRTVDMRLNWDSSMMFMSMPEGWHKVVAARGDDKQALLESPEWRATARDEWDRTKMAMFPIGRLDVVRIVEVAGHENERWLGRTIADVVEERGGHPSDVLADFVLENECRPGLVAVGMANADVDGVARTLQDPRVLISSSDAGAHAQMMCSSGDTTLLLTRHVRDRSDFTLEDAIYQLTGRQADVFGFHRRGVIAPGNVADLNVFALDELTYGGDEFVHDLPQGGVRMRRPTGGYRATLLGGTVVQEQGERTGALPGRVISSIA